MFKPVRKKINEIDHSTVEALLQSNCSRYFSHEWR